MLAVLRGSELEQLYAQLGQQVRTPRVRARAQAAVIQHAGAQYAAGFIADGPPLYRDWPGDFDRAGLLDLIAGAAWWIDRNSHGIELNEIVQAILDVTRWWPRPQQLLGARLQRQMDTPTQATSPYALTASSY